MKIPICEINNSQEPEKELKKLSDSHLIAESYQNYYKDESQFTNTNIDTLFFPTSTSQVVTAVTECRRMHKNMTISGGRTGIVGGAVATDGCLISMEEMHNFTDVRWDSESNAWCLTMQAGVRLSEIQTSLDQSVFKWRNSDISNIEERKKFESESTHWFYPPDPTEKQAQIGGTVATNASGAHSYSYGSTRKHITALEVVLATGDAVRVKRGQHVINDPKETFDIEAADKILSIPFPEYAFPQLKCTSGYYANRPMDLIDFFIGSEGTLGIITEVEVRLMHKPEQILGCIAFFHADKDSLECVKYLNANRQDDSQVQFAALEYFDRQCLKLLQSGYSKYIPQQAEAALYIEIHTSNKESDAAFQALDHLLDEHHAMTERTWCGTEAYELDAMKQFRHAVPEIINGMIALKQKEIPELCKISTDFVIPAKYFGEMFDEYLLKMRGNSFFYVLFGHIGECHLHLNIVPATRDELIRAREVYLQLAHTAIEFGGCLTGEHGIGKLKKQLLQLMYTDQTLHQMKRIKKCFDPDSILGKNTLF